MGLRQVCHASWIPQGICAPLWTRTVDWDGCVSILVCTVFFCLKALDKLVQSSVDYWLLLIEESTAYRGQMAYETWMTQSRCVRGIAGFSILVRFCMFVGLIMAFSLSGRLGQSAGSYLTTILNRMKDFDSCLWQLGEAKLYRVSYVSRFGLALWQSWQSSPSFNGRLTILR